MSWFKKRKKEQKISLQSEHPSNIEALKKIRDRPPLSTSYFTEEQLPPEENQTLVSTLREVDLMLNSATDTKKSKVRSLVEVVTDYVVSFISGVSFEQMKLYRIQKRAAFLYRDDPLIRSVGNLMLRSTIGRGIKFNTGNAQVNEYLNAYWGKHATNLEERQKEVALHRYLLGEYFLVYFIYPDEKIMADGVEIAKVEVRKFYPWEIKCIIISEDDDEAQYGIEREAKNNIGGKDVTLSYELIGAYLNPDGAIAGKIKGAEKDVYVQYIRICDGFDARGFPQVYPMMRISGMVREMMYDVNAKLHEWSKVLYSLTVTKKDKNWKSDTGRRAPAGGTILVNTPEAAWEILESKMDSKAFLEVWKANLYYFAAASGFPYQYVISDYSTNTYASSQEARKPFVEFIIEQQDSLLPVFDTMLRVGLTSGVNAEILPPKVKVPTLDAKAIEALIPTIRRLLTRHSDAKARVEAIHTALFEAREEIEVDTLTLPLQIGFPHIAMLTEKEVADVIKIYKDVGFDMQTIIEATGHDYETYKDRILADLEFDISLQKRRDQEFNPEIPDEDDES